MATGPTVAAYVRCSTREQNDRLQRRAIRDWARANGITRLRWSSDKASGANGSRPGWKKLQVAIRKLQVDTLVCWRLDRLARSLKDAANLFDWLSKRGVRLVSITEGVDLSTAVGRMLAGVLATFAEFENAVRRERQMAGIHAAKAAGKRWGGSQEGWSKIKPPQRKRIVKMHQSGMSKAAIARAEELSWPTVAKILKQAT